MTTLVTDLDYTNDTPGLH